MSLVIRGKFRREFGVSLGCLLAILTGACQSPSGAVPVPAPTGSAAVVTCSGDDHKLQEISLGWSFCYPSRWHYRERFQPSSSPRGVDTTLDVVVVAATPGPDQGEFGFMIIGSYERAGAVDLTQWVAKNVGEGLSLQSISWGNSETAAKVQGRNLRFALTPTRVFELDIHQGQGNLALDSAMAERLASWHFGI